MGRTDRRPGIGRDSDAVAVVHRDGGRMTAQRQHILSVIARADGHLPVAEIYAQVKHDLPWTAPSTIYRSLQRLQDLGLIHTLVVNDDIRYGPADAAHHHTVCTSCGAVGEIPVQALAEPLALIERTTGMSIDASAGLTLRGLCSTCRH